MFATKKKRIILLVLLFAMALSIPVLAEYGFFYWYDGGGTLCKTVPEGEITGNAEFSSPAPFYTAACCNVQGTVKVQFCVYRCTLENVCEWHCGSLIDTYSVDWDAEHVDCACYSQMWAEGKYFESNHPNCCGDDSGEFYVTQGLGKACCNQGEANACVSASGRCRYEYSKETICHDGMDNDCDSKVDCIDTDCQTGTETDCRDKVDNDCDGKTDCSDTDCGMSTDCIGCTPETDETTCSDGENNDCDDGYIDCVDSDCIGTEVCPCEPVAEICDDTKDNDCDGEKDCVDENCYESCGGTCVEENTVALCSNGLDDNCDTLIDNLDHDCPGCGMNTKLCADGSCKESCDPITPQGCIGSANGNCEEGEGCACGDCSGKKSSCERELVCNMNDKTCKCPSGTTMCSDGRCRTKCFVCGNSILEEGEECDTGTSSCPSSCTGQLTCKADCTWDASTCTSCAQCDPAKIDNYCCIIPGDGKCDLECTANADADCASTPYSGDGCKDSKDGKCDTDCINYKDPDCSTSCTSKKDNCCDAKSGNGCDPDCDTGVDSDCGACTSDKDNCCNEKQDNTCDIDCITGVDSDCKCGNRVIDVGETCDSTNLDAKTCNSFFPGYGGLLSCFNANGEHACHFDTSGCHKIPETCTGGSCSFGKDCRCPECLGQQSSCGYGAVCDATARCACIDGTTLCKDSTCRTAQNCNDYDGGEQTCIGAANGVCDVGEGCGCSDCEGKKGPCNALSVCQNGACTGCFLKTAYWYSTKTGQAEDCIGSGNDIKLVAEGLPGCEDKTIAFTIQGVVLPENKAIFKNGKAELVWKADPQGNYKFEASIESEDDKILSKELEVEYCIKECDNDCDEICETNQCVNDHGDYCQNEMKEGEIVLDVNSMTGYCEECDNYGLSKGQETCAAYYDCTPGWWGDDSDYNGAGTVAEARTVLEWGECGVPKVEPPNQLGAGRQSISGNMRSRLICPLELTRQQCCVDQASCYCERPEGEDMIKKGLNCDLPEFRPAEIKGCLVEEKFPFFTNMNILIVVLILTGFYIWKNREQEKTKTKRRSRIKH